MISFCEAIDELQSRNDPKSGIWVDVRILGVVICCQVSCKGAVILIECTVYIMSSMLIVMCTILSIVTLFF